MVDKIGASFLYRKRGVYYFSKQVPCDVKAHYSRQRVIICLKTKSKAIAERMSQSIVQRLEDYWLSLRLRSMTLPAEHLILKDIDIVTNSNAPKLSEALETYLRLKSDSALLFPRDNKKDVSNANSASAALNKWLKPMLPEKRVVNSFRHGFRDRLRAVECPSDIIDVIGGWKTFGIGQGYGSGYGLDIKYKWMRMVEF